MCMTLGSTAECMFLTLESISKYTYLILESTAKCTYVTLESTSKYTYLALESKVHPFMYSLAKICMCQRTTLSRFIWFLV